MTDQEGTAEICRHPYTHISNGDGGAHVRFLTLSTWPTYFLSRLVLGKGIMSLEQAHYKMSALPAYVAGLSDRGMLRIGLAADIIVYEPDRLKLETPSYANDFPGGARRLIEKARGYRYTIVNGKVTFTETEPTGVLPGEVLRSYNMAQ
jgi:N-acyl-D-aspartate/D-glutamate deacylase